MLRLAAGVDEGGGGVASLPEGAENVAVGICPRPNDARAFYLLRKSVNVDGHSLSASWCHVRASEGGKHDDELKAG